MPARHAVGELWKSRANAHRDANVPALSGGANRNYSAESLGRAGRSCRGRLAWHARSHARTARPLARLQRYPAHDHISSCLLAPKPGAFGKTQSLGRHAPSAGATRSTDHRTTAKLFSLRVRKHTGALRAIKVNRPYWDNCLNIALICLRDARVRASDNIIPRTWRRGTFTASCNALAPAFSRSASVRAPINAGKTVAPRTRRFSIACEYCIPHSSPAFAFLSQVR